MSVFLISFICTSKFDIYCELKPQVNKRKKGEYIMVPSIFRNPSIFTDPFLEFDELLSRAKNAVNTFEVSDISFPKFNIYQDKLGNLKLEATVAG